MIVFVVVLRLLDVVDDAAVVAHFAVAVVVRMF